MKRERGITLVSLVVTIIILIILAGVSINLTLGKNGIITIAKQAKENIELAKIEEETALNELYMQIEAEGGVSGGISYDAIAKLTEFKTAIANYIEEAGGIKPETTSDTATFGESIKGIVKEVTKDATATAEDIADGKTAYINGELITGTKQDSISSLTPMIPVLTSNTSSSVGTAIASSQYNSNQYPTWKAFDKKIVGDTDRTYCETMNEGEYIGFMFNTAVSPKACIVLPTIGKFKLQASNDGTNYNDITGIITNDINWNIIYIAINNNIDYKYWRLIRTETNNSVELGIVEMQFYK